MVKFSTLSLSLLLLSLVAVTGCRSSHTSSYLILPDSSLQALAPSSSQKPSVDLVRVRLPEYLRRRELIRLVDGDEVTADSSCRWAVDLESRCLQVLRSNLRTLLGERFLAGGGGRDYEILFSHFELDDGGMLQVEGICREIGNLKNAKAVKFSIDASAYDNAARAHGAALSRLAAEVADWLSR